MEHLTDELEAQALALMGEVDSRGGAVKAIEDGFVQREILRSALQWQRDVESNERVVVGVNKYTSEEQPQEVFKPDPAARAEVLATLARVRAERDPAKVESTLAALENTAKGTGNLLEPMLAAVESYATLGEVCTTLSGVFGKYNAPEVL